MFTLLVAMQPFSILIINNTAAMTKRKTPANKSALTKQKENALKPVVFDQDNTWKNYITKNIFDCLAALHPRLYAAIDLSVPPEFLEQELTNSLKGKYKVKGKEKKTDKLVKLRLLTGEEYYVFVHIEVQGKLEDNLPERIYIYRSLISMKYDTQNISTSVIFTGKSPSEKHKIFHYECFGSEISFRYNSYVIIDQNTDDLEKSDNMFDLAVLAAKYTLDTEGDARRRLMFKKKLYELALQKQILFEKIQELISFVFDYMLLSEDLETEFKEAIRNLSSSNSEEMVVSKGQYDLAQLMSEIVYGKSYEQMIAENKVAAKAAAKTAAKAAAKAEKEVERRNTIQSLLKINFLPEKIADLMGYDLDFVLKVAEEYSKD